MSRNYKFHNSEGLYFVSFAVVQENPKESRKEFLIDFFLKGIGKKF